MAAFRWNDLRPSSVLATARALRKQGFEPVVRAAAAPTTGAHTRGEIVWNSAPSAAGVPGWVCVASGTPGTWKAMAVLAT